MKINFLSRKKKEESVQFVERFIHIFTDPNNDSNTSEFINEKFSHGVKCPICENDKFEVHDSYQSFTTHTEPNHEPYAPILIPVVCTKCSYVFFFERMKAQELAAQSKEKQTTEEEK